MPNRHFRRGRNENAVGLDGLAEGVRRRQEEFDAVIERQRRAFWQDEFDAVIAPIEAEIERREGGADGLWRPRLIRLGDENVFAREEEGKKRGEELFHLILSGIREIYDVEAVIAGGAVRDFVVDPSKRPKDVDVFIPMKWLTFKQRAEELGWATPPKNKKQGIYEENPLGSNARAASVVQGIPVDLVFLDKPLTKKEVDTFPIYAQRCIYTLKSGIVISPLARQDVDNKTFTIDPTITDKERIKKLLERIKGWRMYDCYKDWTAVEPQIKHWWEEVEKDEMPF